MSGTLFGFFGLGLKSLQAAQAGIQVTGNNIANVNTPGYAKRRLELEPGVAIRVPGGILNLGVEISQIRRQENRFIQFNLEREQATLGFAREHLRGLQDVESLFGKLDGDTVFAAYGAFSDAFSDLASQPESLTHRRAAITAADTLARRFRDLDGRLQQQQRNENEAIGQVVEDINRLAESLARLNEQISNAEAGGAQAAALRDQRVQIVEQLVELTGGRASEGEGGRLYFNLNEGATLVTGSSARPLTKTRDINGFFQIALDGQDFTARARSGKLGAMLQLRDDDIAAKRAELDQLAADLITRANAAVTSGVDLDGNTGVALFEPDPPGATGAAGSITLSSAVSANARLLGVSATGAPGDATIALQIAGLQEDPSAALGNNTPAQFLSDAIANLGNEVANAEVSSEVATNLVDNLVTRREAVSGVSLDEEAVDLIRHQRAYEAAARYINLLNEITEVTISVGR